MRQRSWFVLLIMSLAAVARADDAKPGFSVHDMKRPQPAVVTPGTSSTQDAVGKAPSDAKILFDGKDLSSWQSEKGEAAPWKVVDSVIEIVPHTGVIKSKEEFADLQLHLEWMELPGTKGESQARGNSGVFLQGLYEVQVLDCYQNETYPDGTTGGLYGQYPPLVNACRPQGEWQMYDIVFHPAKVDGEGKVLKPARATVFLNGLLVQDDMKLIGPSTHSVLTTYPTTVPTKGPIQLQDHGNPVRFRNIWVRDLPAEKPPAPVRPADAKH
jgi:hypothetical protein